MKMISSISRFQQKIVIFFLFVSIQTLAPPPPFRTWTLCYYIKLLTSAQSVVVLLEVGHHPTTEAVPGIESLLLHQEVHQLRQTLVVPDPEHKMKETVNFLAKLNVVSLSPKNLKFFPSCVKKKKKQC